MGLPGSLGTLALQAFTFQIILVTQGQPYRKTTQAEMLPPSHYSIPRCQMHVWKCFEMNPATTWLYLHGESWARLTPPLNLVNQQIPEQNSYLCHKAICFSVRDNPNPKFETLPLRSLLIFYIQITKFLLSLNDSYLLKWPIYPLAPPDCEMYHLIPGSGEHLPRRRFAACFPFCISDSQVWPRHSRQSLKLSTL